MIREHVAVHGDLAEAAVVPRHLSGSIHAALAEEINKQSTIHEQTRLDINHFELNWVHKVEEYPTGVGVVEEYPTRVGVVEEPEATNLPAGRQRCAGPNGNFHQTVSCGPPWSPLTVLLTYRCELSFPVYINPEEGALPRPPPHPPSTRHHQSTRRHHV